MKRILTLVAMLALAGCETPADIARADDATCAPYGTGEAYRACRTQLMMERQAADNRAAAAALIMGAGFNNAASAYRAPTTTSCSDFGYSISCTTR